MSEECIKIRTSEAILALARRADFLAQKIASYTGDNALHRERTELRAIKLAIAELELRRERMKQEHGNE